MLHRIIGVRAQSSASLLVGMWLVGPDTLVSALCAPAVAINHTANLQFLERLVDVD
jgi:hypothetical protein